MARMLINRLRYFRPKEAKMLHHGTVISPRGGAGSRYQERTRVEGSEGARYLVISQSPLPNARRSPTERADGGS